jgi:iron complex transport system permease protein
MLGIASLTKQQKLKTLGGLLLLAAAVFLLTPLVGAKHLSWTHIFPGNDPVNFKVFWQMRIPRSLVAFFAGAILAGSGMVFQAIFRNPLVCPFTLGISGGASFGATIYIRLGLPLAWFGISGITFFAFLGALLSVWVVWKLARVKRDSSIAKMLLAGLVVSFFFMSLIMFVQYSSDLYQSMRITRWLMGGLFVYGYKPVLDLLPFIIVGLGGIWMYTHELNLLTTGEELAASRGMDVRRTVKVLFIVISLAIGGVVSVCGPIAFVGIIAPHVCRLLIGSDHRYLTPATFLFGGLFLVICDTLARILAAPSEIPVGVITALIGGPFFLWLLHQRFKD